MKRCAPSTHATGRADTTYSLFVDPFAADKQVLRAQWSLDGQGDADTRVEYPTLFDTLDALVR